jgi:predicted DNA binding protein
MIDEIPDGIQTEIEEIGESVVSQDTVTARLSDRQQTAIQVAIEVGYYEIPRRATHADVFSVMVNIRF